MELEVRCSSCSESSPASELSVEVDLNLTKSHSDAELQPSSKSSPLPVSGNPLGDGLVRTSSRFIVSRVSEEQLARSVASSNADSAEKHSTAPASAHGHHKSTASKGPITPASPSTPDKPAPKPQDTADDPTKAADPSTSPKPEAASEREPFIILGVCAMGKKAKSKYMTEILTRITSEFEQIKTLIFNEAMILNEPVESWPRCDALISFYSGRFPLDKAAQYAKLRQPFLINDLQMQYAIQDRRKVYEILKASGVELPRYAILDRSSANPADYALEEYEDYIVVRGQQFNKPFVEKPISADDHNIYIYYPVSAGSGSQRLFRKIGTRSSVYSNENKIRTTGSYIYEEFMPTDGTDVKVYTVGPEYAHAEARKSPALDGVVERDKEGKELRFPIILNNIEKLIARRVCIAFKQTVCGFDLLRANGRSYVCDVNGFSFVKNSMFYYNDFAKILANIILRRLAPEMHIHWSMPYQLEDPPIVPTTIGRMMELRCMVAVIRHGDRTPKQKMKMELRHPKFLAMYKQFGGKFDNDGREIKLKRPSQLQEVLNVVRDLLINHRSEIPIKEARPKLIQLKSVLEMYGHFSGINRKCQIKYQALDPSLSKPEDAAPVDVDSPDGHLVLIMKWGGELTPLGKYQSEQLGQMFRCMYPGSNGASAKKGHGLLRLHSTFRHDLKIYASDEGRVQTTAAAFAKGLLALEGELTPILVQMVKSANTNGLLDSDVAAQDFEKSVKKRLKAILKQNKDFDQSDIQALNPTESTAITAAMETVKNPVTACEEIHKGIKGLNVAIREKMAAQSAELPTLYTGESWELLQRRWGKLEKDFRVGEGEFDITKIPDIYDCIRFDMHHNQWISRLPFAQHMYIVARSLAEIVVPLEYGISAAEKMSIAQGICSPLLWKIHADLNQVTTYSNASTVQDADPENGNRLNPRYEAPYGKAQDGRSVRSRLYFTSESHIHSLVNMLRFGGLFADDDAQWARAREHLAAVPELNFLTQIVIMLYEDTSKEPESDERFHVEIHFSPGMIDKGGGGERDSLKNGGLSRRNSVQQQPNGVVEALALEEGKKPASTSRQVSYAEDVTDSSATINYPKTKRDRFLSKVMESGLVTNKIFSTAVIRGISADIANTATEPNDDTMSFRVPNVWPLETLHNALSFKKLDVFFRAILEASRPAGSTGAPVEHSKSIDASAPSVAFSGELSESWTMEHVSDRPSDTSQLQPAISVNVPPLPAASSPAKNDYQSSK